MLTDDEKEDAVELVEEEQQPAPAAAQEEPAEPEEVVVTIGEEEDKEEAEVRQAPQWVRELRKTHRDMQKENRKLRQQLEERERQEQTKAAPTDPGLKPKIEQFDYDAERFEKALDQWHEKRALQATEIERQRESQREAERAWQQTVGNYEQRKKALSVPDYHDAEDVVTAHLNEVQQGMILSGAEDPALVVYALGKNPKKLQELAAEKDHVRFAFAVAKLETQMKLRKQRKAKSEPESVLSGTGPVSGTVDSQLERLREEAAKTGDFTKVAQYRRQARKQG